MYLYNKADWKGDETIFYFRLERLERAYIPSPDDLIKLLIQEALDTFIPRQKTRPKDSCPWVDKELHDIMKKRDKLLQRFKDERKYLS